MGSDEAAGARSAPVSRRGVLRGAGLLAAAAAGGAAGTGVVAPMGAAAAPSSRVTSRRALAQPTSNPYITVPPSWGTRWRAARQEAGTRHVKVHFWGDSITVGDPPAESWAGDVSTHLRTTYGDGGSGWVPHGRSTATGTWTGGIGMGGAATTSTTANNTRVWSGIQGTTIKLWYKNKGTTGQFQVRVDGGAWQAVTTPNGFGQDPALHTVAGLADADHTVEVMVLSGTVTLYGCEGIRGTTGILPARCAQHGRAGSDYTGDNKYLSAMTIRGEWLSAGGIGAADLVIVALGINDPAHLANTGSTYREGLGHLLAPYYNDINLNWTPDVVFLIEHRGNWYDQEIEWPEYTSELTSMAAGLGAACVDVWGSGRRSWKYWQELGYWAGGSNPAHPSPAGHANGYAAPVIELLDS